MSEVPISFILSLLIVVALVRYSAFSDKRIGWLARAALAALALQSVLLGLRWSYQIRVPGGVQALSASLIPPLIWLSLNSMVSGSTRKLRGGMWLHLICPPLLVVGARLMSPDAVDVIIVLLFFGYGAGLIYKTYKDDIEWLDRIPIQFLLSTNMAFRVAGAILIFSTLIDITVAFDMSRSGGSLAPNIVGIASLFITLALFGSIATVGRLVPELESPAGSIREVGGSSTTPSNGAEPYAETAQSLAAPPPLEAAGEDLGSKRQDLDTPSSLEVFSEDQATDKDVQALYAETLQRLDALMISKRIYRDPNLSLSRMARKLVMPSRQISAAINSQRAMNVPQYVNMFRVMEACELLRNSSTQITEVIFCVGFQTKSNFNREFQRIVCMSPSDWRQSKTEEVMPESMTSFIARLQSDTAVMVGDALSPSLLPTRRSFITPEQRRSSL